MRAIVLDYKKGRAALLLEDGTTTYRRMRAVPGEYVDIPDTDGITRMTGVMRTIAAMLVLVLGLGSYYSNVVMEYSYVSVDVNPSIEFSLNRRDRVVRVSALNRDAGVIVDDLRQKDISGRTLYEAMELTVEALVSEGYMDKNEAYMLLDVASGNHERGERLTKLLNSFLEEQKNAENVKYALVNSSLKDRDKAQKMNISSGRYEKMLEAYDPKDVSGKAVHEYKVKPVKELVDPDLPDIVQASKDKSEPKNGTKDKPKKEKASTDSLQRSDQDKTDNSSQTSGNDSAKLPVVYDPSQGSSAGADSGSSGNAGASDTGKTPDRDGTPKNTTADTDDETDDDVEDFDASEGTVGIDDEEFDDFSDPSGEAAATVEAEQDKPQQQTTPAGDVGQGDIGPYEKDQ